MTTTNGGDSYRAWMFTLASTLACVFGAGLIFIDTIAKKALGRDVSILQNHKFLAGSLGLGSGVMIFSSFYNLLPEAKEQLSSDLSIFSEHADAYLMLFFFTGVGLMALIHWVMHRFDSGANSPGIENSGAIEQFMRREAHATTTPMAQHSASAKHPRPSGTANGTLAAGANTSSASPTSTTPVCHECIEEDMNESGGGVDDMEADEDERYHDSEYVDDEVASLLNNAFLQIGTTPNGRLEERNGPPGYEDDQESIEVVIGDQKDKILRRTLDHPTSDDNDDEQDLAGHTKKKKAASGAAKNSGISNSDGGSSSSNTHSNHPHHHGHRAPKVCPHRHPPSHEQQPLLNQHSHGASAKGVHSGMTYGATGRPYPSSHPHSHPPPANASRSDPATHLRRTSFPRLKTQNSIYSTHDNLDHAVADDREHADLTEIGIQTALTIAVHKFPEGMITFLSTTADPCLGLSVFTAIAVHNLIEGYLIAFPLFIGLHSRTKAFALAAALGGLSQPMGAVLGWFILRKVASLGWKVSATGCIYAVVAGMMASIAVNGMWPQAVKCVGRNKTKVVQYSFFGGIAVMGICQAVMGSKCDF
ncbi:hypothetical protein BGZ70_005240 [Mortierella alpina]|uniref:Uncharacterized protein n=1 Tax=Mortierella alpina TaxID=64518 RepID=A0A9P6J953_MORAP|nr:hypothetical protein BGZ70_005240 [Mortierella alpina]